MTIMTTMKDASQQLTDRFPGVEDLLRWIGKQERKASPTDGAAGMLASFALGTMVGGAVALLLAPQSGVELRGEISQRLGEAKQRVNERLGEATDRAREAASSTTGEQAAGGTA
jgi:hypothetical protein